MDFDALTVRPGGYRLAFESAGAFGLALIFLLALAPGAPFTKDLGVCESGAVRDVLAGNIILPHYSPGTPVQLPPLYWWAAAITVRLFGWDEIGLRAPSLLATAGACAILFAWLSSSIGRRVAMWAVPVFLSTQYIVDAARQPRMDAILMMLLTAALVCLERALSRTPWRQTLLTIAAGAMGCAILTKGPLGVILPGLTLLIFLAAQRRLIELFRLDIIATFAVAALIGVIWYLAALRIGGNAFFEYQIVHGLFRRFLGAGEGIMGECQNPFYYFFPKLVTGFLPWSLFYPALIVMLWTNRIKAPPPIIFALCWFAAILGFFTISVGKCLVYILPLFPALAAMIAWMIACSVGQQRQRGVEHRLFDWATIATAAGIILIILAGAMLVFFPSIASMGSHLHRSDKRFLDILVRAAAHGAPGLMLWMTLSVLGAVIAISAMPGHRVFAQSAGVGLIALAGTLFWYGFMNPSAAKEETLKPFASLIDQMVPPGTGVDYIGQVDCDLAFYSSHEVASVNHFQCSSQAPGAFFVVWQDRLGKLSPDQLDCLRVIAQSAPTDSHGARLLMVEH